MSLCPFSTICNARNLRYIKLETAFSDERKFFALTLGEVWSGLQAAHVWSIFTQLFFFLGFYGFMPHTHTTFSSSSHSLRFL